jgi:hypothetical protein
VSVSLRLVVSIDRRDKAVIILIAIFVIETVSIESEPSAQSETAMVAAASDPTNKGLRVRIAKSLVQVSWFRIGLPSSAVGGAPFWPRV